MGREEDELNASLRSSKSQTESELADLHIGESTTCGNDDPNATTITGNVGEAGLSRTESIRVWQAEGGGLEWKWPEFKFDMEQLPEQMRKSYGRVKDQLERECGEEYALQIIFAMLTAEHLHRAWNMTPLTANVMKQLKKKFDLQLTWELGVLRLKFRIQDGAFELHRKVPYDYDSEFQDKFMRIANALINDRIDVSRALQYQVDVVNGAHTASSGLFLRENPAWPGGRWNRGGRLILYPLVAATCTVIFFGGGLQDAGAAVVCGLVSGLIEWGAGNVGQTGRITMDMIVGIVTGAITGAAYLHMEEDICISSILLGTLYWFFYGTAFVVGLLEIIAGELETGVTRFIAVSVKTFVLCLGAGFGLMMSLRGKSNDNWFASTKNCGSIDLEEEWWRIPLYLLCCVGVLGNMLQSSYVIHLTYLENNISHLLAPSSYVPPYLTCCHVQK